MMFPALKLSLHGSQPRDHPLLRRDSLSNENSVAEGAAHSTVSGFPTPRCFRLEQQSAKFAGLCLSIYAIRREESWNKCNSCWVISQSRQTSDTSAASSGFAMPSMITSVGRRMGRHDRRCGNGTYWPTNQELIPRRRKDSPNSCPASLVIKR